MAKPWMDVSVALCDRMVHWPGDPGVSITLAVKLGAPLRGKPGKTSPCNVTRLEMSAHTGTHMDSPRHFIAKGRSMESVPLDAVVGPCRVIAIRHRHMITVDELRPHKLRRGERILFRTRNSTHGLKTARRGTFDPNFVYVPADTAGYLVERGVRTVGVDYFSVGGYEADGVECHQILLRAEVWIIEGLDLSKVDPGAYDLICLPLKILGADGAPARAILRKR